MFYYFLLFFIIFYYFLLFFIIFNFYEIFKLKITNFLEELNNFDLINELFKLLSN